VSPRSADPEHLKLLLRYSESIQKLALAARKFILMEAPDANEFVYEVYTIADHFTFTDRPSDAFVFVTTHAEWINVGFNFGSLLRDPDGLLRGDGKFIRHIRITQEADLEAPGIRALVRAAIADAEPPRDKGGKPRTVVRMSQSTKKNLAPKQRQSRAHRKAVNRS
jgi:hypothetical protein